MSEDGEIVQAFLEESRENLDQLDRDLVSLESRPGDPALLARVFRAIHTVKGTCGFLGFRRLEALTHAGENLLGAIRAGDLALDGPVTDSLLALIDAVRSVLREVETSGTEGADDHAVVIAALARQLARRPAGPAPADDPGAALDPLVAAAPPPAAISTAPGAGGETSVRVDVAVLDKLLDLVGELVLARSQIMESAPEHDDGPLSGPYRQLRLVTGELQEGVMRARLQPVGSVTGKFRRVARDLAAALGKNVRVELEGEDVGVDKAVNEALRDPLLHLVRNVVDHGLETPSERIAAGKPAEGLLRIRAYHQGGRVFVEVSDDGRGVDVERLVQRAVAGGLTDEEAAGLTPVQRLELMFLPGLSTKDEVTSVSGRGVGMDVVRADLAQVGGRIEVSSEPGVGSVFLINVPLTLAIMPALVIWCSGGRYAIPQVDVVEILHVDQAQVAAVVDEVNGVRLHRLRGRLLPLVELTHRLGLEPAPGNAGLDIVVVQSGDRRFGLVVDGLGDTVEAVVKPLTRVLSTVPVFVGVTILADGLPALILDVAGLADSAGVQAFDDEPCDPAGAAGPSVRASRVLLAAGAEGGLAFRLDAVQRLERFPAARVERKGSAEVVQYGDTILSLIRLSDGSAARQATGEQPDLLPVVVCSTSVGPVGFVVDRIDDVVEEPPAPELPAARPGAAALLVIGGRVIELVDVESAIAAAGLARSA